MPSIINTMASLEPGSGMIWVLYIVVEAFGAASEVDSQVLVDELNVLSCVEEVSLE